MSKYASSLLQNSYKHGGEWVSVNRKKYVLLVWSDQFCNSPKMLKIRINSSEQSKKQQNKSKTKLIIAWVEGTPIE